VARVTAPQQVSGAAPSGGAPGPRAPDPQAPDPPRRRPAQLVRRLRRVPARLWWTSIAVLAVAVVAISYALTRPPPPADLTPADVTAGVQAGLERQAEQDAAKPSDATLAHAAVAPSLVLVTTRSGSGESAGTGSGAGVVVNADGMVLTALHVVDGAASITVSFSDGTSAAATIDERNPESDIATLRPQRLPDTVVPAVLGGGVQVGAPVFAVGHPLGLTDSLSAGVVSALDRTVTVEGNRKLEHLIQFDAAVNPGNSGGPLLNKAGQVVGIVTGLANPSDQTLFVGIGFAVPIATAGGSAGAPPH
jgi:S1-C subfamily serine protease